jgi:hypothetical protein
MSQFTESYGCGSVGCKSETSIWKDWELHCLCGKYIMSVHGDRYDVCGLDSDNDDHCTCKGSRWDFHGHGLRCECGRILKKPPSKAIAEQKSKASQTMQSLYP